MYDAKERELILQAADHCIKHGLTVALILRGQSANQPYTIKFSTSEHHPDRSMIWVNIPEHSFNCLLSREQIEHYI